jgi:hypothetical protein
VAMHEKHSPCGDATLQTRQGMGARYVVVFDRTRGFQRAARSSQQA